MGICRHLCRADKNNKRPARTKITNYKSHCPKNYNRQCFLTRRELGVNHLLRKRQAIIKKPTLSEKSFKVFFYVSFLRTCASYPSHFDFIYSLLSLRFLSLAQPSRYTRSTETSAGLTPEILDACPIFVGRIVLSFCLASSLKPSIAE